MDDLKNWAPCELPSITCADGRFVRVEQGAFPEDGPDLFRAICGPEDANLWRYIPFYPPKDVNTFNETMAFMQERLGCRTQVLRDVKTNEMLGMASYFRNRPEHGSTEVGCIIFSKKLQQTPAATEAMYLMARHVFDDLGYRRYEWKCNNENLASRRAANRLGFTFEGVFRQDMVVKGLSRDTAWYSITDKEWPTRRAALEAWLDPSNFDENGKQRQSLQNIRRTLMSDDGE
ncbi:MAG: GNAT family protein [Pseudomonadota bacterium]